MAYADTIDGKTVDRTYSKVVNLLDPVPFVRSFNVTRHASDKHTLTINQNRLIGTYPTRDAALGALVGCSLKAGGGGGGDSQARAIKALNQMVTDGKGVFEGVETQVLTFALFNGAHGSVSSTGPDVFCELLSGSRTWWQSGGNKMRLWYGTYARSFGASAAATVESDFSDSAQETAYLNKLSVSLSLTPSGGTATTYDLGTPPTGTKQGRYVNSDVTLSGVDLSSGAWTVVITTEVVA